MLLPAPEIDGKFRGNTEAESHSSSERMFHDGMTVKHRLYVVIIQQGL